MDDMIVASGTRELSYRCIVGHEIALGELDRLTVVVDLDAGAEVRICREHGAPIAMRLGPVKGLAGHQADTPDI